MEPKPLNVRLLWNKHEFLSGELVKSLPTTFIPRDTTKLVLNSYYAYLAYHFTKSLCDDNDVIPVTAVEIVFVFSNCGPKPRGQADWTFDQNVEELRKWLVQFVLRTVVTGRWDIVPVDFEKVDFKWLAQGVPCEATVPNQAGSATISIIETAHERKEWTFDATQIQEFQDVYEHASKRVESIEFLTLTEYVTRLAPGQLELETQEDL